MDRLLEDLWLNYQLDKTGNMNEEMRAMLHSVTEKQKELYSELNEAQKTQLEEYEECHNILSSAIEKESFLQGVSFAVSFILEAVKNK